MARGCGIACPISNVHQTRATAAADMFIHIDIDRDLDMGLDMEHQKLDMYIRYMQKCVLCFQVSFLQLRYKDVQSSKCPKLKPQLHSEVRSSCGSSLVRVGVHNVAEARVLGMSDSATSF